MRKLTLLIFIFTLSIVASLASPKIEAGKRYHISCLFAPGGCVVDGASVGQNTPLYYLRTANQSDEAAWLFQKVDGADYYYIINAKTGQYITYDGVRQDSPELRRYVCMSDKPDGDNSLWYFSAEGDGNYSIFSLPQNMEAWDLRTGSYCVGTHAYSGDTNQVFFFTDEEGKRVPEHQPNDIGSGFIVSSWLGATEASADGWTFTGDSWSDPNWGDYYNGDASVSTPFLERWHDSWNGPLSNGTISQTLKNLPQGKYEVAADVIAVLQGWGNGTPANGVTLFANGQSTQCSTYNERPESYVVEATVGEDGTLTLGLKIENTNANWVAFDNLWLVFMGTEEEMMEGEKNKIRLELADYYSASEIEVMISQAGDNFDKLEELRKSTSTLASIDPLARALKDLTIGGHKPVWVESLDLYLTSLPLEHFDNSYTARIDYEPREGYGELTIDGKAATANSDFTFATIEAGREYVFNVKADDGTVIEKKLTFTSLPVVKMYGSFNNDYLPGSIAVYECDKEAPELMSMKAKWRGGITNGSGKHKRNYHVKLLDENGEKKEQSFFGLRNDNSWILESCQVDMSRIRNRVLTDLWNAFCTKPYYIKQEKKAMSGTRGHFVELILNDEYRGIYCMTENLDRKQMKLKKIDEETQTVHGQLWKSKDWSYGVFMGHDSDNNNYPKRHPSSYNEWSEMWENYEVKYPDFDDYGYQTDWSTLYDAVDFVCTATDANFRQHFTEYFDLPVVMDYYILMETILSTDNHGKNMFFACYDKQEDKRITLAVWDMDATCGQRWSDDYYHDTFLGPEQDYAQFITRYEHGDYNLFRRLRNTNTEDFNMQVRLRYRDLRQNELATENILNRFRTYLDEFKRCGADQREYDKWSFDSDVAHHQLNFDVEMDYLTYWFTHRMDYLDRVRFKIDELPSDISDINRMEDAKAHNAIYDLQGQKVGTADDYDRLPAGIYIINGKKSVKK